MSDNEFNGVVNPEYAEHSLASKAKKVITGPLSIQTAVDGNGVPTGRSIAPIAGAANILPLALGKTYRVISDGDMNIVLYKDAGIAPAPTAAATDIYIPAKTPIVVRCDNWDRIAYLTSGTFVQAVEIL